MRPVFVVWHDAASSDAWENLRQAGELPLAQIHTLGFLLSEDATRLVVTLNRDRTNDNVSQCIAIPKVWIQELRYFPEELTLLV